MGHFATLLPFLERLHHAFSPNKDDIFDHKIGPKVYVCLAQKP
jgi:hypothetical protein